MFELLLLERPRKLLALVDMLPESPFPGIWIWAGIGGGGPWEQVKLLIAEVRPALQSMSRTPFLSSDESWQFLANI